MSMTSGALESCFASNNCHIEMIFLPVFPLVMLVFPYTYTVDSRYLKQVEIPDDSN